MKFSRPKFLDRWLGPKAELLPAAVAPKKDPAFFASTDPIQDAVLIERHEEPNPAPAHEDGAASVPEAPIVEPSSDSAADANAAPAPKPVTQEDFNRMKGRLDGAAATGSGRKIIYPPPQPGLFARWKNRLIDALPWEDSPPEIVAIAEKMDKENKSFAIVDESVLQPARAEVAPVETAAAPASDASTVSVEAEDKIEKPAEPGVFSRGLGVIAGALAAMKARASSAPQPGEQPAAPDGVVGRALARNAAESPAEAPGAQEPTLKPDGFAGRVPHLDNLREPTMAAEDGPPEGVEPPVLNDAVGEADLAQMSANAGDGEPPTLQAAESTGYAPQDGQKNNLPGEEAQKIIDEAVAKGTAEPLYPSQSTRTARLKNYFTEKAGRAKDFVVAQVKQTESLTRTFIKSAAFTAGVHVGVKMVFNNSVRALDLGGVGTALGTGFWSAGSEILRDSRAAYAAQKQEEKSKWQALRTVFNKEHGYGARYGKRFGAGFGGGLLGALTFDLVTDVDDVADKVKNLGGWLRDHMPGISSDVPAVAPEAAVPAEIAPQAGEPVETPQPEAQPPAQAVVEQPAVEVPAEPAQETSQASPIEAPSSARLMEMLAQRDDLSDKAKEILAAAQRGEAWALDSFGVGVINAGTGIPSVDYGFPTADALGLTPEQMDRVGAESIQDAAEKGNVQGMRNNAFHQYNGIRGIEQNVEAAVETAKQHGPWAGGESALTSVFCDATGSGPLSCAPTGVPFEEGKLISVQTADGVTHGFKLPEGAENMNQAEQDEVIRRALLQVQQAVQSIPATALAR